MTFYSKSKGNIFIQGLTSIFIVFCFLLSLNFSQEAYAESKKVSGTIVDADVTSLAKRSIRIPNCEHYLYLNVRHAILRSDDPDWNNASYFYITYKGFGIDQIDEYNGYGSISHPGGNQTFYEFAGKRISAAAANSAGETEGIIIHGTGKFEGIKARWLIKWKKSMAEGRLGDWTVEYF